MHNSAAVFWFYNIANITYEHNIRECKFGLGKLALQYINPHIGQPEANEQIFHYNQQI